MVTWDRVTRADVLRAMKEYDRLGPERFFSEHGFAPTTTYELAWEQRRYPPKAILGTAYEFATGQRLDTGDLQAPYGCSASWDSPSRRSDDQRVEATPRKPTTRPRFVARPPTRNPRIGFPASWRAHWCCRR